MSDTIEEGDWSEDVFINADVMKEAFERFWTKKQLGIDANGKVYRTDLDRKRPKHHNFSDHNWMFDKKKAVKIKVDNGNDSY